AAHQVADHRDYRGLHDGRAPCLAQFRFSGHVTPRAVTPALLLGWASLPANPWKRVWKSGSTVLLVQRVHGFLAALGYRPGIRPEAQVNGPPIVRYSASA